MRQIIIWVLMIVITGTVDSFGQGTVTRSNKIKKENQIKSVNKSTPKNQFNPTKSIQGVVLTSEDLYEQGRIKEGDGFFQEAEELYKKAAEQGHYKACRRLGDIFYYGHFGLKNEEEGLKWYSKCADQSSAEELAIIAYRYEKLNNTINASIYYQMSAEKGKLISYWNLGNLLTKEGRNNEALKWYQIGAGYNEPYCQAELGELYFLGLHVSENKEESIKWLKKAVDNGHPQAKSNLKIWHNIIYP